MPRRRRFLRRNGVIPSHAAPSCVSGGSSGGSSRASASASTCQCAKSRPSHVCACTHGSPGARHGRCPTSFMTAAWRAAAPRKSSELTPALCPLGRALVPATAPEPAEGQSQDDQDQTDEPVADHDQDDAEDDEYCAYSHAATLPSR